MSDRNATIGFIGMGMMGGGMAANLLKAGFDMAAYDIDPAKNERFAGLGAKIANGPAGVAQAASTVICIVETTAQVREVVLGDGGIVEGAQEGDIFVCSATVDPLAVKELHDILAEKGIRMLDAPVSGGVPRAVSGDLSIIVGGETATVDACRPYFEAMSSNVFHMGEIGLGLAMKLCNNMITQVTKVVIAESMALGTKAGLDPKQMFEVIKRQYGQLQQLPGGRAPLPQRRLLARRHHRYLLQGPGARDRLCQGARRADVHGRRVAAGLSNGAGSRPQQGGRQRPDQALRGDGGCETGPARRLTARGHGYRPGRLNPSRARATAARVTHPSAWSLIRPIA